MLVAGKGGECRWKECAPKTGVTSWDEVNVLKRNSDDVGWEYGFLVDANNKDKVECKKSTQEAKDKCKKSLEDSKRKRKEQAARELELREEVNVSWVGTEDDEVICVGTIPFNACDNDEFKQMCEAIGQFGSRLEPPSLRDLRESLLDEEYARTKSLLQEHEAEKVKNGFVSSKEMSDVSHTSEVIFELVDKAIEDIGPDDVVQVVTDNASNNMGAKKLLLEKRPNIF
ncbi:uncharacterized protein [Miscanthus floridulus]|uniref:uncharacterized protein n=1 Tax=Miscanthus floridulus TaxID=154761 RepID=UPI003457A777